LTEAAVAVGIAMRAAYRFRLEITNPSGPGFEERQHFGPLVLPDYQSLRNQNQ
jgi:hypothetical protein